MQGQPGSTVPEVKFFRNALWPPNLAERTPDQSVMHRWVKGHAGVNQKAIAHKCVRPSNVANATEHYAATGALVLN